MSLVEPQSLPVDQTEGTAGWPSDAEMSIQAEEMSQLLPVFDPLLAADEPPLPLDEGPNVLVVPRLGPVGGGTSVRNPSRSDGAPRPNPPTWPP